MANGTVNLGSSSGTVTVGGKSLDVSSGAALDGYSGSITIAAGGGNNSDNVTLNGQTANEMTVSATPETLTTDQNTPVTFQANVNTSFADSYNLTALAPLGWSVSIDSKGNITTTPAAGLQGGTYPIQIIAQSTTNPNLVGQTTVNVAITPTQPGITFSVQPDPEITVPFDGAQVPSAFRAIIPNNGPTADTYNLTFSNVPSGFTVLSSATSLTVPAGQTGIVGIYLQPNGSQLPAPGTKVSFSVTATSITDSTITQTQNGSFTMPAVNAVSVTDDPAQVNTLPGLGGTTTLTLQNTGNESENEAVLAVSSPGLTVSGLSSPVSLAVGGSSTQTLTLTSDANTPLNSTLQAAVTVGPAVSQNTVSVVNVTPSSSFAEAGQTVSVSADVLNGVTQTEQAQTSFTVLNSAGKAVFISKPVSLTLSVLTNVVNVNLGSVETSGLAAGQYTIQVSIADSTGKPISGASGTASLVIDSPVGASLTVNSDTLSPTDPETVFTTLDVGSQTVLGSVPTDGEATSVALKGNLAYVANTQDIAVVNVSDPTNPQIVTTFGSKDINQGGLNLTQLDGNNLVVVSNSNASSFNLLVYSLANPSNPKLVSNTTIPYAYASGLVIQGNTAFVPLKSLTIDGNGNVTDQSGDFVAVDLSNPSKPNVLFNNRGAPEGGNSNQWDAVPSNSEVAYVAGTTSTGVNTQSGTSNVLIVNTSNPAQMSVAGQRLCFPFDFCTL